MIIVIVWLEDGCLEQNRETIQYREREKEDEHKVDYMSVVEYLLQ